MHRSRCVKVGGISLEVDAVGAGEPVVIIQTALDADELRPLAGQVARLGRHRSLHYHRRGYGRSSPVDGEASIARDAADCRDLISALGIAPAHVLGASYSAAVAMTLASMAPEQTRTVTAIEAPPGRSPEFRAANARLFDTFRRQGAAVALDEFMTMLTGPHWRVELDGAHAGSVSALERDAATFFGHDVPALQSWDFDSAQAVRITCPVLYIGGADTWPIFERMRRETLAVLPHAQSETITGAGHLVASTHPVETAHRVFEFLERHADTG